MGFRLRDEELEISHLKGSGPGGQNRNKRMSGVRIVHLPTGIVVTATERRSQAQNLEAAKERLILRLEALYHRPIPRIATKRTRSSKAKRVDNKRQRGNLKKDRRISRSHSDE